MKKKILGGLLVVAIAAVAAFNVTVNTEKNELSALGLANVEALAYGEAQDPILVCTAVCYPYDSRWCGASYQGNEYWCNGYYPFFMQ